ncbi:hypothetical protein [Bifidobacterium cuniculi]|uniref:Uncharacterized protein n=1 Tax=Bifidobacterium cuniculi TaxID=1688 RepID=A0A087ARP1_9BIFI|nr:hypothetical protein [Bifidobacterium cuniculi]KFI61441.1 hypothetical protein BCUN_1984 [Bifidobacterium cuniculi]
MSILQGFEAVNPVGPTGKSVLTVTPRYIRFNKNSVLELDSPRYVQLLTNPQTKQIAIKVCNVNDPNAVQFVNPKKHTASVTLTSPVVLGAVLQFFEFPEVADDQVAYAQLHGVPYPDDQTIIYDVDDCVQGVMRKRGRKKASYYAAQ